MRRNGNISYAASIFVSCSDVVHFIDSCVVKGPISCVDWMAFSASPRSERATPGTLPNDLAEVTRSMARVRADRISPFDPTYHCSPHLNLHRIFRGYKKLSNANCRRRIQREGQKELRCTSHREPCLILSPMVALNSMHSSGQEGCIETAIARHHLSEGLSTSHIEMSGVHAKSPWATPGHQPMPTGRESILFPSWSLLNHG